MPAYLLCSRAENAPPDFPLAVDLRARAMGAGMDVIDLSEAAWVAIAGPGRPAIRTIGGWTLVGDVHDRLSAPVHRVSSCEPGFYEKKMLARFWGRFVGVRLDAKGRLGGLMRDPSGALDCLWWAQGPLTLVASDIPDWLAHAACSSWRIDRAKVEAALHDPYSTSGALMLEGPSAVLPGTMQDVGGGATTVLWRPDWIARAGRTRSDSEAAECLRGAVDETLAGVVRSGGVLAAEISGGLDSSIVAASLVATDRNPVRLWINAWGPDASADERPWIQHLAARLNITATSVPRAVGQLTLDMLEGLTTGVRPGFAALDALHDTDWARRLIAAGVDTVVTGKGGDAMFIQPADISVFVDLYQDHGWRAIFFNALRDLARWNERSVWTVGGAALRRSRVPNANDEPNPLLAPCRDACPVRHPWLMGIEDLGPAKRRQILGLVQGCGLHGASLQTEVASVIHPLLAQPVTEACLALPTYQLTLGKRDRALARRAFSDRLPAAIVERRSKGEMTAFYGHLIADGLAVLRPWLLEGRLAAMGLIDRDRADVALTRESLAWRGGYVDIMMTAAVESWVRAWARRLPAH
ncbi:asparagine synthase C-terminal domain-containing protein [Brevundimonas sp.]|uniref:asparagine synthase C-terminal domain-containing protein n=1 Tax=Brevundimonas sp. TaxID=1871086 RepID=UPI0028AC8B6D|nr:asparagine synthase C-terminal domain-containing protein [Brevundimonas sp.]